MPKRRRNKLHQTGKTTPWLDLMLSAKKPGKRRSKSGKTYYEYRKNRSDMPNRRI